MLLLLVGILLLSQSFGAVTTLNQQEPTAPQQGQNGQSFDSKNLADDDKRLQNNWRRSSTQDDPFSKNAAQHRVQDTTPVQGSPLLGTSFYATSDESPWEPSPHRTPQSRASQHLQKDDHSHSTKNYDSTRRIQQSKATQQLQKDDRSDSTKNYDGRTIASLKSFENFIKEEKEKSQTPSPHSDRDTPMSPQASRTSGTTPLSPDNKSKLDAENNRAVGASPSQTKRIIREVYLRQHIEALQDEERRKLANAFKSQRNKLSPSSAKDRFKSPMRKLQRRTDKEAKDAVPSANRAKSSRLGFFPIVPQRSRKQSEESPVANVPNPLDKQNTGEFRITVQRGERRKQPSCFSNCFKLFSKSHRKDQHLHGPVKALEDRIRALRAGEQRVSVSSASVSTDLHEFKSSVGGSRSSQDPTISSRYDRRDLQTLSTTNASLDNFRRSVDKRPSVRTLPDRASSMPLDVSSSESRFQPQNGAGVDSAVNYPKTNSYRSVGIPHPVEPDESQLSSWLRESIDMSGRYRDPSGAKTQSNPPSRIDSKTTMSVHSFSTIPDDPHYPRIVRSKSAPIQRHVSGKGRRSSFSDRPFPSEFTQAMKDPLAPPLNPALRSTKNLLKLHTMNLQESMSTSKSRSTKQPTDHELTLSSSSEGKATCLNCFGSLKFKKKLRHRRDIRTPEVDYLSHLHLSAVEELRALDNQNNELLHDSKNGNISSEWESKAREDALPGRSFFLGRRNNQPRCLNCYSEKFKRNGNQNDNKWWRNPFYRSKEASPRSTTALSSVEHSNSHTVHGSPYPKTDSDLAKSHHSDGSKHTAPPQGPLDPKTDSDLADSPRVDSPKYQTWRQSSSEQSSEILDPKTFSRWRIPIGRNQPVSGHTSLYSGETRGSSKGIDSHDTSTRSSPKNQQPPRNQRRSSPQHRQKGQGRRRRTEKCFGVCFGDLFRNRKQGDVAPQRMPSVPPLKIPQTPQKQVVHPFSFTPQTQETPPDRQNSETGSKNEIQRSDTPKDPSAWVEHYRKVLLEASPGRDRKLSSAPLENKEGVQSGSGSRGRSKSPQSAPQPRLVRQKSPVPNNPLPSLGSPTSSGQSGGGGGSGTPKSRSSKSNRRQHGAGPSGSGDPQGSVSLPRLKRRSDTQKYLLPKEIQRGESPPPGEEHHLGSHELESTPSDVSSDPSSDQEGIMFKDSWSDLLRHVNHPSGKEQWRSPQESSKSFKEGSSSSRPNIPLYGGSPNSNSKTSGDTPKSMLLSLQKMGKSPSQPLESPRIAKLRQVAQKIKQDTPRRRRKPNNDQSFSGSQSPVSHNLESSKQTQERIWDDILHKQLDEMIRKAKPNARIIPPNNIQPANHYEGNSPRISSLQESKKTQTGPDDDLKKLLRDKFEERKKEQKDSVPKGETIQAPGLLTQVLQDKLAARVKKDQKPEDVVAKPQHDGKLFLPGPGKGFKNPSHQALETQDTLQKPSWTQVHEEIKEKSQNTSPQRGQSLGNGNPQTSLEAGKKSADHQKTLPDPKKTALRPQDQQIIDAVRRLGQKIKKKAEGKTVGKTSDKPTEKSTEKSSEKAATSLPYLTPLSSRLTRVSKSDQSKSMSDKSSKKKGQ